MGILKTAQLKAIEDIRAKTRTQTITIVTKTSTGADSGDIYGAPASTAETTEDILGIFTWGNIIRRTDSPGGVVELGECTVLIDLADKSKAEGENKTLRVNDINLRILNIQALPDTQEAILYCERV